MYEIGHCWTSVQPNATLQTSCPRLDPLVDTYQSTETSVDRICYPEETVTLDNGEVEFWPMGWQDIGDLIEGTAKADWCKK